MAKLDFSKLNGAQGIEAIDTSMTNLVFQLNVNKAQADKGILGKVLIFHPAFTTRATLFQSENGIIRVSGSSLKTGETWFNVVTLEPAFREHIISEYHKEIAGERNEGVWYLNLLGSHTKEITDETNNESLDIKNLIVMTSLSEKQTLANMLCKVTVVTTVATLRSFAVYKSKFGEQLYGVAQNEDPDNTIPSYTLSRECEAQVLNVIHPVVTNWDQTFEKETKATASKTTSKKTTTKTVKEAVGLQTEVPEFDSSLYEEA